uniref:Fructose-bisphosphatase n=1 Tax=Meloidogyne hapla TaxID=6305 RepID=A0A1I8B743_MELHA
MDLIVCTAGGSIQSVSGVNETTTYVLEFAGVDAALSDSVDHCRSRLAPPGHFLMFM